MKRLLDLFCGAGGAAVGYARAGFEVVGVDLVSQPNYPFKFYRGDARVHMAILFRGEEIGTWRLRDFDAIHASPPCQAYTNMNRRWAESRAARPALIAETREALQQSGLPWVIENVSGAVSELRNPIQLCGRSLGLPIHRHRLFEANFSVMAPPCTGGRDPFGVYGKLDGRRLWTRTDGSELRAARTLEEAQEAMGMPWADWDGIREAIPPAMTEHLGHYLLNHIRAQAKQAA